MRRNDAVSARDIVVVAGLVGAAILGCRHSEDCCAMACSWRALVEVHFDGSLAEVVDGQTEICVDGACKQVPWLLGPTGDSTFYVPHEGIGGVDLSQSGSGEVLMRLHFGLTAEGEHALQIRISSASGAQLVDVGRSVLFVREEVCCDPNCGGGYELIDLRTGSDAGSDDTGTEAGSEGGA